MTNLPSIVYANESGWRKYENDAFAPYSESIWRKFAKNERNLSTNTCNRCSVGAQALNLQICPQYWRCIEAQLCEFTLRIPSEKLMLRALISFY